MVYRHSLVFQKLGQYQNDKCMAEVNNLSHSSQEKRF